MGIVYMLMLTVFFMVYGVFLFGFESTIVFLSDPWGTISRATSFVLTPFDPILKPIGRLMTTMFLETPFSFVGIVDDLIFPKNVPYVPSLAKTDIIQIPKYNSDDYYC